MPEVDQKDAGGAEGKEQALLKIVLLSSAGNVLEWMDFSVYAFLAREIGHAFFPEGDTTVQLVESFSVFAGAFVIRPLGGVLFGHIGDLYGKKFSLQLSLFLMALSTTLMGVLPTYRQIGLAAPALLTLFRMLQGLAVGGQLVGCMVYVDHHAPKEAKGYYGGVTLGGGALGVLLGSLEGALMVAVCTPEQLQSFGFRVPFLMGFLVALAGLMLHKQAPEISEPEGRDDEEEEEEEDADDRTTATAGTDLHHDGMGELDRMPSNLAMLSMRSARSQPSTQQQPPRQNKGRPSPLVALLRRHKTEILLAYGATILWCTAFYCGYVWISTFLTHLVEPPVKGALWINSFWLLVLTVALPYGGHLSDKHGVYPVMLCGALWLMVSAPLSFLLFQRASPVSAFLGQALLTPGILMNAGPLTAFLTGPATTSKATYTAVAVIYNLAQATFGGVAMIVATALAHKARGLGAGLWISGVAVVTALSLAIGAERQAGGAPGSSSKSKVRGEATPGQQQGKGLHDDEEGEEGEQQQQQRPAARVA